MLFRCLRTVTFAAALMLPGLAAATDPEPDWCEVRAQADRELLDYAEELAVSVEASNLACVAGRMHPACVEARAQTDELALEYHRLGILAHGHRGRCPDTTAAEG